MGNAQDLLSTCIDTRHRTDEWVKSSIQSKSGLKEKLDTRSLPEPDLLKNRKLELKELQRNAQHLVNIQQHKNDVTP